MINEPSTAKRNNAGQHHMRQRLDKHTKQTCERPQYRRPGPQQLPNHSVKRQNYCNKDQNQQKLLPQGPVLPWRGHELADLVDRPSPDKLDKPEDRGNSVSQESQKLIENLLHGNDPDARRSLRLIMERTTTNETQNAALGSQHLARLIFWPETAASKRCA